ncbi:MAG: NADPH-dependent reductase [Ilumatobacteraceae bacterium]|nr:NADPH-dependent reductase [Ilumatobacteraceae bacterium]
MTRCGTTDRRAAMILLVSGSLRAMSTNTALLRTVAALADDTSMYERMRMLPHFDPDDDVEPVHPEVQRLRDAVESADAVVMCTPEYAGALPGSFKNALDWLVGSMAMNAKPTAVVSVSAFGASKALASLRTVLGYVSADMVEDACVHIAVDRRHVGADGMIDDTDIKGQIGHMLGTLRAHVQALA